MKNPFSNTVQKHFFSQMPRKYRPFGVQISHFTRNPFSIRFFFNNRTTTPLPSPYFLRSPPISSFSFSMLNHSVFCPSFCPALSQPCCPSTSVPSRSPCQAPTSPPHICWHRRPSRSSYSDHLHPPSSPPWPKPTPPHARQQDACKPSPGLIPCRRTHRPQARRAKVSERLSDGSLRLSPWPRAV